jgi:hypothetical protein
LLQPYPATPTIARPATIPVATATDDNTSSTRPIPGLDSHRSELRPEVLVR